MFASLGMGLALPLLVLSVAPGWQRLLPRPGRWMERMRALVGFSLLGAAVWLLWLVGRAGVPLYLVYNPSQPDRPEVLPELLTRQMVRRALQRAAAPRPNTPARTRTRLTRRNG